MVNMVRHIATDCTYMYLSDYSHVSRQQSDIFCGKLSHCEWLWKQSVLHGNWLYSSTGESVIFYRTQGSVVFHLQYLWLKAITHLRLLQCKEMAHDHWQGANLDVQFPCLILHFNHFSITIWSETPVLLMWNHWYCKLIRISQWWTFFDHFVLCAAGGSLFFVR